MGNFLDSRTQILPEEVIDFKISHSQIGFSAENIADQHCGPRFVFTSVNVDVNILGKISSLRS